MLVTAAGVVDTLRLVAPGFVALEIFYLFGLRTRRIDAQWLIFSLIVSTSIFRVFSSFGWPVRLLTMLPAAVAVGAAAVFAWRLAVRQWPTRLRKFISVRVWDSVLAAGGRWVHVELTSGTSYLGYIAEIAESVETDDPDLHLQQVSRVEGDRYVDLKDHMEGLVIPRSSIRLVAVLKPATDY